MDDLEDPDARFVIFMCPRCCGAFEWRVGVLPYPIKCLSCGYGRPHWNTVDLEAVARPLSETREYGWPWIHRWRARRDQAVA